MSTIFDITNSKGFIFNNRLYFNELAAYSVELLDDLLVLIEGTPDLKELEYILM